MIPPSLKNRFTGFFFFTPFFLVLKSILKTFQVSFSFSSSLTILIFLKITQKNKKNTPPKRLGETRELINLIPATSQFSQMMSSVMLVMPLEKQLLFVDKFEKTSRWRDRPIAPSSNLSSPSLSPSSSSVSLPSPPSSEERSLYARFPKDVPAPLYYQRHEGRPSQCRWGVKNERVFPVSELMRQSMLFYLRRDIVYKKTHHLEELGRFLAGFDGKTDHVSRCVLYIMRRSESALRSLFFFFFFFCFSFCFSFCFCFVFFVFLVLFGLVWFFLFCFLFFFSFPTQTPSSTAMGGILGIRSEAQSLRKAFHKQKKEIETTVHPSKDSTLDKEVTVIYDQYKKDKPFVALLGITASLRSPLLMGTWEKKDVKLKKKKNVRWD